MRGLARSIGMALLLVPACSSDPTVAPVTATTAGAASASVKAPGNNEFVVYTQNVYPGADLDAVFANPGPATLVTALQQFAHTNWPERAATIAKFVQQNNPDVIALNEMSTVKVTGFDALDQNIDFLPVLMAALANRGLHYVVAGQVANLHPFIQLSATKTIDWQDHDVVLVRNNITVSNVQAGNYPAPLLIPNLSFDGTNHFDIVRGYVIVDITDGRRTARFAASHIEDLNPELNVDQS
jgi:hypothetical protein